MVLQLDQPEHVIVFLNSFEFFFELENFNVFNLCYLVLLHFFLLFGELHLKIAVLPLYREDDVFGSINFSLAVSLNGAHFNFLAS